MSVKIMTQAWLAECKSHTEKLVLVALADNANDDGHCWPGTDHIAKKCNLSRQGVFDQIESLVKQGHLTVKKHYGTVNRYVVKPVNPVDQSTPLTSQRRGLPPVNTVDYHQSTALTGPVNPVDPNRKEPSLNHHRTINKQIDAFELYPELDNDDFKKHWNMWHEHLKQKKKPATVHARDLQLSKLSKMGCDRAVEALKNSIEKGYQGIYEAAEQQRGHQPPKPKSHFLFSTVGD